MGRSAAQTSCSKKANLYVAHFLPLVILGLLGFASWVFTRKICLDQLRTTRDRPGLAIALIVLNYITLAPLIAAYLRVVYAVNFDPGLVPLPDNHEYELAERPSKEGDIEHTPFAHQPTPRPEKNTSAPSLAAYANKAAYVCEADGMPRYCSHCRNWKPDRAHHCREVGRCVWRMDHFCPWVGGVVSETSTRYFFQTVFYGTIHTLYLLITVAWTLGTLAEGTERQTKTLVIVITALAGLFFVFTTTMTWTTLGLLMESKSTIDTLTVNRAYSLALWDPEPPSHSAWPRVVLDGRSYVIVRTQQGVNPWRRFSRWENFKSEMGGDAGWWKLWGVMRPGSQGGSEGFYRWNEDVIAKLREQAEIRWPPKEGQEKSAGW